MDMSLQNVLYNTSLEKLKFHTLDWRFQEPIK